VKKEQGDRKWKEGEEEKGAKRRKEYTGGRGKYDKTILLQQILSRHFQAGEERITQEQNRTEESRTE
jgi:hypothetical protein